MTNTTTNAITKAITVIGAGMAGSAAAFAAAEMGVTVHIYEMRPHKMTPAHHTDRFAELVCSNSLGSRTETNAKGLLQAEMLHANNLIMHSAEACSVPAGNALAVDRDAFGQMVTETLEHHPHIHIHREEMPHIPEGVVVLAAGPLSSDALAEAMQKQLGSEFLGFYDAAAPVLDIESINLDIVFRKGRYEQGADYLNVPMSKEDYDRWYEALMQARSHTPHEWEKLNFFEGCMPIEELARRGYDTPRFGPMKPVGLRHPETETSYFAVAQLRQEDVRGQMWSLVGFQTGLKWGDQKEVIRTMPGLENAEIIRYGVMHRNTYFNAPQVLEPTLSVRKESRLWLAGVLAGTEGYLESASTGWLAGTNAARQVLGLEPILPPETSMLGALTRYLATAEAENFQPMNANWGLVPTIPKERGKGKQGKAIRRKAMYDRGLADFKAWFATAQ